MCIVHIPVGIVWDHVSGQGYKIFIFSTSELCNISLKEEKLYIIVACI